MKKLICILLVSLYMLLAFTPGVAADSNRDTMNIYGLHLTAEGDATLIESNGKWLLIDTGFETSSKELVEKLSSYGVREVDVLISHYHNDHTGGFKALAESKVKINRLFIPDASLTPYDPDTDWKQNQLRKAAQANNSAVSITSLKKSDTFTFGNVTATVLGPVSNVTPDDFEATAQQSALEIYVNCRSLTVRFDCGDASYLSAGDIEMQEEKALIKAYSGTKKLDADVMKLSHHGLHTSNTPEFLALVTPECTFAHNSEKTISEGMDYRMYYTSCKNASAYGPVYLIGEEKADVHVAASGNNLKLFKGTKELKGIVSLAGGDGTVTKNYKYYITGNHVKEGVYTVDGKKYFVSEGGFVNKAYYSHLDDRYIYWHEPVKGGDVRYFDLEGVMCTGFHKVGEYYYYFDSETGLLHRGDADQDLTIVTIEGKKYALYPSGVVYNYGKSESVWREFGDTYGYFDTNGVMHTGWLTLNDKKYYLDPETGLRVVGLKEIDGVTYYFVETNNAAYAWNKGWKNFDGEYRYFESDGKMKTGWLELEGKKYYLDNETGYRLVGLHEIDGDTYYFVETNSAAYAWCKGKITIDGKTRNFGADGKEIVPGGKKTTTRTTTTTTKSIAATTTTKAVSAPTKATTGKVNESTTATPADDKTTVTTTDQPLVDTTASADITDVANDTTTTATNDTTTTVDDDTIDTDDTTTMAPTATQPDDTPTDSQPAPEDNHEPSSVLLIVILSAIAVFGVAIGAFFLLRKKNADATTPTEHRSEE